MTGNASRSRAGIFRSIIRRRRLRRPPGSRTVSPARRARSTNEDDMVAIVSQATTNVNAGSSTFFLRAKTCTGFPIRQPPSPRHGQRRLLWYGNRVQWQQPVVLPPQTEPAGEGPQAEGRRERARSSAWRRWIASGPPGHTCGEIRSEPAAATQGATPVNRGNPAPHRPKSSARACSASWVRTDSSRRSARAVSLQF